MQPGHDPARFGKPPSGTANDPTRQCLQAPSVIEVRMPAVVHSLRLALSRAYLIEHPSGLLLVDAGSPGEERRILHAGRAICDADGRPVGSIVTHAMLDYANLPFILSQSPYVELMRPVDPLRGEDVSGRDIEFAFYGWSRRPLRLRCHGLATRRCGFAGWASRTPFGPAPAKRPDTTCTAERPGGSTR
jgi:hypothetical protein